MHKKHNQPNILIYNDEGASPFCVQALICSLTQESMFSITLIDRFFIRDLLPHVSRSTILIFPGGRDIPYHAALSGDLNKKIYEFVSEGGRFLGICAGGYYGSAYIEFEKGTSSEIIEKRELRFFPDIAYGPIYGNGLFSYSSEKGARVVPLIMSHVVLPSKTTYAYYNGGCTFLHTELYPHVTVIARYKDIASRPPAIISCTINKGVVLLSGVHPEYSANPYYVKDPLILNRLKRREKKRKVLFSYLLSLLCITLPSSSSAR